MISGEEEIRDFYGHIIARVETMPNGDKKVKNFYGHILGYYRKSDNTTRDFYGKIIAKGEAIGMLIK